MAKLKQILFNTEMVQKIMAGKKTETRRAVLPQPEGARFVLDCDEENRTFDLMCGNNGAGGHQPRPCGDPDAQDEPPVHGALSGVRLGC